LYWKIIGIYEIIILIKALAVTSTCFSLACLDHAHNKFMRIEMAQLIAYLIDWLNFYADLAILQP
jgi:hypothetical protein